jgi:hypothetical protein
MHACPSSWFAQTRRSTAEQPRTGKTRIKPNERLYENCYIELSAVFARARARTGAACLMMKNATARTKLTGSVNCFTHRFSRLA